MPRLTSVAVVLGLLGLSGVARGDSFDHYTNPVLNRLLETKNVREVKQLVSSDLTDHDNVLPGITSTFLVVKTAGNRNAKLLVQAAKQRVSDEKRVPILYIERYVTYKDGEERAVLATGKGQSLYPGFRFSLDLGQMVPEELGGDLRFVVDGDKVTTEPVGKAKLYLVTRALPDVEPKKAGKFVMGEKWDVKYFNGTFKLYDDGRRAGSLTLVVDDEGNVTGSYYSDSDGQKYEVVGKAGGTPRHAVEFRVKLPRVEQSFRGLLFTGDGKTIAGTSRLLDHEAGFYAVRQE